MQVELKSNINVKWSEASTDNSLLKSVFHALSEQDAAFPVDNISMEIIDVNAANYASIAQTITFATDASFIHVYYAVKPVAQTFAALSPLRFRVSIANSVIATLTQFQLANCLAFSSNIVIDQLEDPGDNDAVLIIVKGTQ